MMIIMDSSMSIQTRHGKKYRSKEHLTIFKTEECIYRTPFLSPLVFHIPLFSLFFPFSSFFPESCFLWPNLLLSDHVNSTYDSNKKIAIGATKRRMKPNNT